ncbi:hypothetical protein A6R68_10696 [Neotoma lepida]|uniref:Uncharacterized protein n=1 Tax=Neotoma lepida TaxID=56216 RepID=A0A1A6FW65_NEOLE|nr:hypothetical protein A6R68_10696 [Neotoma lepida]
MKESKESKILGKPGQRDLSGWGSAKPRQSPLPLPATPGSAKRNVRGEAGGKGSQKLLGAGRPFTLQHEVARVWLQRPRHPGVGLAVEQGLLNCFYVECFTAITTLDPTLDPHKPLVYGLDNGPTRVHLVGGSASVRGVYGDGISEGLAGVAKTKDTLVLTSQATWTNTSNMSSNKEAAVEEVSLDPEGGETTDVCQDGPCSLQDLNLAPDVASSQSSLSEDEVETKDNSEFDSGSKLQVLESGVMDFQDHREQSVSSASAKGDFMDCLPLVNDKVEEMVQQPRDQVSQGARSRAFSKSCTIKQSTPWANSEGDRSKNGRLGKRLVDAKPASVAPLHYRRPKGGRACKTKKKKKSTKSKKTVPEDIPNTFPDLDSASDEDSEMQVMRVTICFKNGRKIISSNAMDPEDRNKNRIVKPRGNFHHMTGSLQMSAPGGHILGTGKLGASCFNRKATVFRGKEQSRPRYPGAIISGQWKASSKKKLAQEKKHLLDAPRITGRRPVPLLGQKPKAAPVETATFPPISCVPTLESSKKRSTTSLEVLEPAHGTSRKRAVAKNIKEALPAARGDRGLVCKDNMKNLTAMTSTSESYKIKEIPRAQRAEQPCMCTDRGEMSSGDSNFRAPQVTGIPQFLSLSQRSGRPRAPAPAGDQCPSVVLPLPVGEKQHQAPGTLGCQQTYPTAAQYCGSVG